MRQSVLKKSLAVSLLVHAGLLGLLLLAVKTPVSLDKPIRIRLLEPPQDAAPPSSPSSIPQPDPRPAPRAAPMPKAPPTPPARSGSSERELRGLRMGRPEGDDVSVTRRPTPAPDTPPAPPESAAPAVPSAPIPPPQVAARPTPEPSPPPAASQRELRQEPQAPERSGLSFGGPAVELPAPPLARPPADIGRPSLRDQIAGFGSGLRADLSGPAKQTLNLDDRRPRFLDYLGRLKQRIQGEWTYPEDAQRVGMSGELVLIFTLSKTGTLTHIQLVESSGFPLLDNEALRAVKTAAPFDPFPPQMGDEPWNISAIFRYQSSHYFRRY
jgi:periplasmic protein TonB